MELTEGVYEFPLELDAGDERFVVHPSGVETAKGLVLFDAGTPGSVAHLERAMAEDGFDLGDVRSLVLTHQDPDHAGGAAELVERTDATVYAHRADAPAIDGSSRPIKVGESRYPPVTVDVELGGGEAFDSVAGPAEVIPTHGHTPGHVSIHLPDAGLLLAADALTAPEGRLAGPREEMTPDLASATDAVFELSTLAFDATLCYHGGFVEQGADAVAAVFDDLRERDSGFETSHGDGPRFLRRELGAERVGLGRFVLPAGERHGSKEGGNTAHRHTRQEELYLFLSGAGTMKVDDRTFDVAAGDAVRVERSRYRAVEADDDVEFVVAGAPVTGDEPQIVDDFW